MKKFIATVATLLALSMVFVSCSKGGDDESAGGDTVKPAFTANYTGKDGDVHFDVEDDYVSVEVEFVELVEGIQFAIKSDGVKTKESWGTNPYAKYQEPTEKKTTIILADVLTELKAEQAANTDKSADDTAPTKIAQFCIQNTKAAANSVKVLSAKIKKADDSVIDAVFVGDGWNGTVAQ